MVRHMYLQKVQLRIYLLYQPTPLHHLMDCSYTPTTDRLNLICYLVMDVSAIEHRTLLIFPLLPLQPSFYFLFPSPEYFAILLSRFYTHLKCPFFWLLVFMQIPFYPVNSGISTNFTSLNKKITLG